jgi:hypothetical protein
MSTMVRGTFKDLADGMVRSGPNKIIGRGG